MIWWNKPRYCEKLSANVLKPLENGIFPVKLKIAKVISIHKKDIMVLQKFIITGPFPFFVSSKIYEKVIYNRIIKCIETNNLIFQINLGLEWMDLQY